MINRAIPSLQRQLDWLERALLAVLFGFMCWTFIRDFAATGNLSTILLLVSEGAVLAFILVRRSTQEVSLRPTDWLLAFFGTMLPFLARPASGSIMPSAVCLTLMLLGLVVQISAKLVLRRSFGAVAANRGVKIGGPYRFIRHPMYAGYLLTHIGFLLLNPSPWNLLVYGLCTASQVGRIMAEEKLLGDDQAYRAFTRSVRFRLLPGVF